MRTIGLIVVMLSLAAPVLSQAPTEGTASTPNLDVDLAASWKLNVQQAEQRSAAADASLKRTPEYKAYSDAVAFQQNLRKTIIAAAEKRYPGFTLDLEALKLVPLPAAK